MPLTGTPAEAISVASRRQALRALVGFLLALPARAADRPSGNIRRIGFLDQGSVVADTVYVNALRQGLRQFGWIEGENLQVEARFANGRTEDLSALAADLVRDQVDLIATWSTPAALAAKKATGTIPIVIGFTADPVGSGIVASLARPGGNVTGWTHSGLELRAKYLELLRETVPETVRVGVLWNPDNQAHKPSLRVIESAARQLNVELHLAGATNPKSIASAFEEFAQQRVQALVVFPDGMLVAQAPLIISLAAKLRLPAMYGVRQYAAAGGLLVYGANLLAMQRRIGASMVDKILRGARPGDLPVEQPTEFELIINLKTAAALGLKIPQSVLLQANEVIR